MTNNQKQLYYFTSVLTNKEVPVTTRQVKSIQEALNVPMEGEVYQPETMPNTAAAVKVVANLMQQSRPSELQDFLSECENLNDADWLTDERVEEECMSAEPYINNRATKSKKTFPDNFRVGTIYEITQTPDVRCKLGYRYVAYICPELTYATVYVCGADGIPVEESPEYKTISASNLLKSKYILQN